VIQLRFALVSAFAVFALHSVSPTALAAGFEPEFTPCEPRSDFLPDLVNTSNVNRGAASGMNTEGLDLNFCSEWNPDFATNGHHCCAKLVVKRRRRGRGINRCAPERRRGSFCADVTSDQKSYADAVRAGKFGAHPDVLKLITAEMGRSGLQAYCSVNNGFLVRGRPVVPSEDNRIQLRNPARCSEYGTDSMVGMLEWLGRQVKKQYPPASDGSGTRLILGDVAPPRGGCTGHASHRTGQDADIGFLAIRENGGNSPVDFHRTFDAKASWWFIKQVLKNPYACVRVIFLDRRLINKLPKVARGDEEWQIYRRFIRHMPGHRNHIHVRVGNYPGPPGCVSDAKPELEEGDDAQSEGSVEGDASGEKPGEPDLSGESED
jgi:murein endopeptidase